MGERRLKIADVARDTGLHRNTITLLYYETATRVDIESIEQLCRLFNCNVGELFEYLPDSATKKAGASTVKKPRKP
jgi:putative transcriptional regulator